MKKRLLQNPVSQVEYTGFRFRVSVWMLLVRSMLRIPET